MKAVLDLLLNLKSYLAERLDPKPFNWGVVLLLHTYVVCWYRKYAKFVVGKYQLKTHSRPIYSIPWSETILDG